MSPALFMVPTPCEGLLPSTFLPSQRAGSIAPKGCGYLRIRPENVLRTDLELPDDSRAESSMEGMRSRARMDYAFVAGAGVFGLSHVPISAREGGGLENRRPH